MVKLWFGFTWMRFHTKWPSTLRSVHAIRIWCVKCKRYFHLMVKKSCARVSVLLPSNSFRIYDFPFKFLFQSILKNNFLRKCNTKMNALKQRPNCAIPFFRKNKLVWFFSSDTIVAPSKQIPFYWMQWLHLDFVRWSLFFLCQSKCAACAFWWSLKSIRIILPYRKWPWND